MFGFAIGGVTFVMLIFLSSIASKVGVFNTHTHSDFILLHLGFAIMSGIFAQNGLESAIEKIIKKNK